MPDAAFVADAGPALWQVPGLTWPECEVVAQPDKRPGAPKLLVRRRPQRRIVFGPHQDEALFLPGYPCISLFTGCGGMDIGLERAGMTCLVQHEWAGAPCQTLIANRPRYFRHAALIQGDLRQTPTEMLLNAAGLRVGQTEIVFGGPPCQGFTRVNKHARRVEYDPRNDLVYEFLRVIDQAKPAFFVMENVADFQHFNEAEYLVAFLRRAYGAYYELVYGLLNAMHYGVPQHRVRFICMGTRRDIALLENRLAGLPCMQNFASPDLNLIRAVDGSPLFTREQERLSRPPGIRYFPDRPVLIAPSPTSSTGDDCVARSYWDFYDRLAAEEPDRLVTVTEKHHA